MGPMPTKGGPGKRGARPAVDERIVMPETRFEVIDGEVVHVSPADEPHGSRHSKLSALLEAFCAEGYNAASDMLTRTSAKGDMAPDGSIYPSAPDPETEGRQLEHLAFEVVSTETLAAAGRKAASLVGRGVRRVFALDVTRQRALEWSKRTDAWEILPRDGAIDDPALALPLPVHDLVVAARADDAMARALLAKQNPVLTDALDRARGAGEAEGRAEGRAEGGAEGKAEAVLLVLRARGIAVSRADEQAIRRMRDLPTLDRWLAVAATCKAVTDVLGTQARPRSAKKRPSKRKR